MTSIGIFIFEGAEELDFVGPWEVLAMWAQGWPDDGAEVFTMSREGGVVTCAKGMKIIADHSWTTAPAIDVLIYPGGKGMRSHIGDQQIHAWLESHRSRGVLMTSVCTGSLVFADAGLLDGRPATTHWESIDLLGELGTRVEVRAEERFVDSGEVITASGVSAGIDMALHLVSRLHSANRAREVRRAIQYDPAPPV